jgi:hypothetical protein
VRFLFRWAFRLFVLLVILLVAALLLLNTIAREILENRIQNSTGMEVRIGSVSVGLLSPVVDVENFKIYNPAEFGGSPFLDIPELHLEYDRNALFSRRVHCRLLRFTLNELAVVRSKAGMSNLQTFSKLTPKPDPRTTTSASNGRSFCFDGIDTLNVTANRMTMMDMSDPSHVRELKLGIRNQVIVGVKNGQDLQLKLALLFAAYGGAGVLDFLQTGTPR